MHLRTETKLEPVVYAFPGGSGIDADGTTLDGVAVENGIHLDVMMDLGLEGVEEA